MAHQVISVGRLRVVEPRAPLRIAKVPAPEAADALSELERSVGAIELALGRLKVMGGDAPASRGRGRPSQHERDLRIHLYRVVMEWTYREIGAALALSITPQAIGQASRRGGDWLDRRFPGRRDRSNPSRPPEPAEAYLFDKGRW